MNQNRVSVCLATYNEEQNIRDCLESIRQLAKEIVIVDGSSHDQTVKIAKKYGAKIIIRENPLMFHINKQKAFEAATGDWILYLDADERVSPELSQEITKTINQPQINHQSTTDQPTNGFWIPRKNIIFGKWIKNDFWYPDYQLRLFRAGKAYLPCVTVHEQPKLTGKAGYLMNPLIHYNYRTVAQFVKKLNDLYTENDAKLFLEKGDKIYWHDAIRFPTKEFIATFFARKGYRDGLHGLVLSLFQSFSALVTFAKIWEAQGFKDQELPLSDFGLEIKNLVKETNYWLTTTLIEKQGQSLKRTFLKIKRRFSR